MHNENEVEELAKLLDGRISSYQNAENILKVGYRKGLVPMQEFCFRAMAALEKIENNPWGATIGDIQNLKNIIIEGLPQSPAKLSVEQILKEIINHMQWNQEGYDITDNEYLACGSKWDDGRPNTITKIKINQKKLAQKIHKAIYGKDAK